MQKNKIRFKKLKIKKRKEYKKKGRRKKEKQQQQKVKLHGTAKWNVEAEVYNNNKKCD